MSSTKSKICLGAFSAICSIVLLVGVLGHIYFPTIMRGKVAQVSDASAQAYEERDGD